MQLNFGFTSLCDVNCGVKSVNRQAQRQTDRQIVGPRSYDDIFYLQTVIIGVPIKRVGLFV